MSDIIDDIRKRAWRPPHWCIDNPKTEKFAGLLTSRCWVPQGMARIMAVGLLELLRHFTLEFCPERDPGRWENYEIAESLGWNGDPDTLIAAFIDSGWIKPHPELRLVFRMHRIRPVVPAHVRAAVLERDGMCCQLCGGTIASRSDIHLDHIDPYSMGGTTTVDNLQVAHAACNIRKGAKVGA